MKKIIGLGAAIVIANIVSYLIASFIAFKVFMSKRMMKSIAKKSLTMSKELAEEMDDMF